MTDHKSAAKGPLALLGGSKTIQGPFQLYNSIGAEEVAAAKAVVESGVLSKFLGRWGSDFLGGPKVKEFERDCEAHFGVKHAITVNSWTSGLVTAVGALGIEPGATAMHLTTVRVRVTRRPAAGS